MKTQVFQQLFVGASLLFSLFVATPTMGQAQTKTPITFSIKKGFLTVKGEFKKYSYHIDPETNIYGKAEIASVYTESDKRDEHLQNQEWFDAKNYPCIEMQSTKITKVSQGKYLGTFDIKIKGKTQSKEIPFSIEGDILKMDFELSRKPFNVGSGFFGAIVGDNVKISLNLPIK